MLSNNPHVKFWIDQFNFEDRQVAKDLLDELEYIPTVKLLSEIEAELIEIINNTDKVAIIPVRELFSDDECYFPKDLNEINSYLNDQSLKIDSKSINAIKGKSTGVGITQKDIDGFNPILLHPTKQPGSEALIANLITQLKRRYPRKIVTGGRDINPSIIDLRRERCNKLILVDDVIGSGQRMTDFILSLVKNKTINSWVSGNKIELIIICYMKSTKASKKLSKIKQKIVINSIEKFPTFYELNGSLLRVYEELIEKYSNKSEGSPFGYDKTFGSAIFEHSIPNNIPAIFWRDVHKWSPGGKGVIHKGKWRSLFSGRTVSAVIKQGVKSSKSMSFNNRVKLNLVLKALRDEVGVNTIRQLAKYLGWEITVCKDIVARLKMNLLIDSQSKITSLGLAELAYLEKSYELIDFNKENYYPEDVMG
jgi:hypothetical protein